MPERGCGEDVRMASRTRSATAGAVAALTWAALEPLDQRILRCDYSDVAVLGKTVTRGTGWRTAGLAIHVLNGALFGLGYYELRERLPLETRRLAIGMALAEHVALSIRSAISSIDTTRAAGRPVFRRS